MGFVFKQKNLTTATETTIHTVPGGIKAIYDINICSTSNTAEIDLSVTVGAITTHLEKTAIVSVGSPLVRTKEMFPGAAIIKCKSNVPGVDVTLVGIEEVA